MRPTRIKFLKNPSFWLAGILCLTGLRGQSPPPSAPESSACHVFIDDENIWTLEVVEEQNGEIIPILNIITLSPGGWDFRPREILLVNDQTPLPVQKFSVDTGVPGEPYIMEYLRVRGRSFIGLDLLGDFAGLVQPTQVTIDLGKDRFQLQPLNCHDYEKVAGKIDRINIDSPDIWEDFQVLEIDFLGQREARPE